MFYNFSLDIFRFLIYFYNSITSNSTFSSIFLPSLSKSTILWRLFSSNYILFSRITICSSKSNGDFFSNTSFYFIKFMFFFFEFSSILMLSSISVRSYSFSFDIATMRVFTFSVFKSNIFWSLNSSSFWRIINFSLFWNPFFY